MLPEKYIKDVERIGQIPMIPTMLEVICRTTGMGFAAVARVTEDSWVACSVRDEINFGLKPGGELVLETTICHEIRQNHNPVVIDHVANNELFANHQTPKMYGFQSYISVPIIKKNGEMFGTLCAIDPKPAVLENNHIPGMFKMFAEIIGSHLDNIETLENNEREMAEMGKELKLSRDENRQYQFISNHNLQEPLRKLRVFSNMLMRSVENNDLTKVANMAGKIRSNAQQFSMMIKDLSEFSNLNENEATFDTVDLNKVIEDVQKQMQQPISFKDAQLNISHLPMIKGITPQLEQLFYHIIGNALKFSKKGINPIVSITCSESMIPRIGTRKTTAVSADYIEIRIQDNGIGIEENQLERIFDIFSKIDYNPELSGGGVGLAYCRKIVRNHGGVLNAESTPGKGTTFSIYLPSSRVVK